MCGHAGSRRACARIERGCNAAITRGASVTKRTFRAFAAALRAFDLLDAAHAVAKRA
jgi:hypothetical protein